MRTVLLYLGVSLLCLLSCTSDDSCTSGNIPTLSLSDIGCSNAERVVKLNSPNELELIRDQATFESLVDARCDISIDWQQYDLVIGQIRLSQGFIGMKNSAVFDCVENRIEFTIEIALSNSADAPEVNWSFLIKKDSDFFIRPLKFD